VKAEAERAGLYAGIAGAAVAALAALGAGASAPAVAFRALVGAVLLWAVGLALGAILTSPGPVPGGGEGTPPDAEAENVPSDGGLGDGMTPETDVAG